MLERSIVTFFDDWLIYFILLSHTFVLAHLLNPLAVHSKTCDCNIKVSTAGNASVSWVLKSWRLPTTELKIL